MQPFVLLPSTNSLLQQLSSFFLSLSNNILQHQLFLFPPPTMMQLIAIVTFHFQQLYCTIYLSSSSPSTNSLLQLAFNFPSSYKQHIPLLPLHEQLIAIFTFVHFILPTFSILHLPSFIFILPLPTNSSLQMLPFLFLPPTHCNIQHSSSTLLQTAHCSSYLSSSTLPRAARFNSYLSSSTFQRTARFNSYLSSSTLPRAARFHSYLSSSTLPRTAHCNSYLSSSTLQ
jgi:hypothetical protein